MKKIIALMLTLVFVLGFTACLDLDEQNTTVPTDASTSAEDTADASTSEDETTAQSESEPETDEDGNTIEATTSEDEASTLADGETESRAEGTTSTATSAERTTSNSTSTTAAAAVAAGESKAYAALSSGNFYMACTVTAEDGSKNPIVFANNGNNLRMDVTMKGSNIGIIIADGNMYMLYDGSYAQLDETTLSAFGVSSVEELIASMGVADGFASDMFEGLTFNKAEVGTYKGQNVTKFFYNKGSTAQTILYETAEGKLLCMENIDKDGNTTQTMEFTDFSADVTADKFSVSGYTQVDFYDLMMSMYEVIMDETVAS